MRSRTTRFIGLLRPLLSSQHFPVTLLLLVLAGLIGFSLISQRAHSARTGEAGRLRLDVAVQSRSVYGMGGHLAPFRKREALIRNLKRLADLEPTALSVRKLVLMQAVTGDPGWRDSLARLRTAEDIGSQVEADIEADAWAAILGARFVTSGEAKSLLARIDAMHLDWFSHLARESLHRNTGDEKSARQARTRALQSWQMLESLQGFRLSFGLVALLMLLFACRFFASPKPSVSATGDSPSVFAVRPLDPSRSELLVQVFLVYLLTVAALRWIAAPWLHSLLQKSGASQEVVQLVSALLSLLSLIPAAASFAAGRKVFRLGVGDIGLKTTRFMGDIAWGVIGFLASGPLVQIASVVSFWLFSGFDSPVNPSIASYAGARSVLTQAILLAQAVVLAPVAEEILFRGIFFRAIYGRYRQVPAILLTSGVFAILHPQLPVGFLGLFMLGFVFNLLFVMRGSIWPSVVAHSLNNGMIFLTLSVLLGD